MMKEDAGGRDTNEIRINKLKKKHIRIVKCTNSTV